VPDLDESGFFVKISKKIDILSKNAADDFEK
jgi:hypothetical protein